MRKFCIEFLSYAGRVQLIKSVLFSVQVFWAQIFILPKKVIKSIEATCRKFLWTGGVDSAHKALVAWNTLCKPKTAGGMNFLDILYWNRAAICKMLRNLCHKNDKMWIRWVHIYYGKLGSVWGAQPTKASWVVTKILKSVQTL